MAPWSFLSGSGSDAEAELPAHMEADADQSRTAFTIFIDGALTNIYNEASGRSKDQRALRASLKGVIGGGCKVPSTCRNVKNSQQVISIYLSINISVADKTKHLLDPLDGARGCCHKQRPAHFDVTVRLLYCRQHFLECRRNQEAG